MKPVTKDSHARDQDTKPVKVPVLKRHVPLFVMKPIMGSIRAMELPIPVIEPIPVMEVPLTRIPVMATPVIIHVFQD